MWSGIPSIFLAVLFVLSAITAEIGLKAPLKQVPVLEEDIVAPDAQQCRDRLPRNALPCHMADCTVAEAVEAEDRDLSPIAREPQGRSDILPRCSIRMTEDPFPSTVLRKPGKKVLHLTFDGKIAILVSFGIPEYKMLLLELYVFPLKAEDLAKSCPGQPGKVKQALDFVASVLAGRQEFLMKILLGQDEAIDRHLPEAFIPLCRVVSDVSLPLGDRADPTQQSQLPVDASRLHMPGP